MFKTKQIQHLLTAYMCNIFLATIQIWLNWFWINNDEFGIAKNYSRWREFMFFANAMEADIDKLRYEDVECLVYSFWD